MHELSLHVLDLLENSVRANARVIELTIEEDLATDVLIIRIEDDGAGWPAPPDRALDPFFTTKGEKRIGLGLSLFRLAVQQAGGTLALRSSRLGGAEVRAQLGLDHVDRAPLGDLAATVLSILCTNPGLEIRCSLRTVRGERSVSAGEVAVEIGGASWLEVAREVSARIRAGRREIGMRA